jgi:phytanoyl-CoA hydroxylase
MRTMISFDDLEKMKIEGYVVVPQVFSREEVKYYLDHFMRLREKGRYEGDWEGVPADDDDPLKKYPRMIHMHHWDEVSLKWLLDDRIRHCLHALMGIEPLAVQTMIYFKPPGARGQALHQDQFYLRVQPGQCMAAWMALDPCDEENGCMRVVPHSHNLPLLCTEQADTTTSFTDVKVALPPGMHPTPVIMEPGDVLFFNGMVIHGSFPNTSAKRFRRSLIGHYISSDGVKVADYYHPVLRMDGSEVKLIDNPDGGPCGIWVDRQGNPVLKMQTALKSSLPPRSVQ